MNRWTIKSGTRGDNLYLPLLVIFGCLIPLLGNRASDYALPLVIALLILLLLRLLLGRTYPLPGLPDLGVLGFFALAGLSWFYSVSPRLTEVSLLWLAIGLGAYFTVRSASLTQNAFPFLAKWLVITACATVIAEEVRFVVWGNYGSTAFFWTFYNQNLYGGFLASILPLVFLGQAGKNKARILAGTVIFAGLFLAFSKGAWLVAVIGVLLILFFKLRARDYRGAMTVLAAFVLGMGMGYSVDRFLNAGLIKMAAGWETTLYFVKNSVRPRFTYWRNALEIGLASPLFGHGYGSFASTHLKIAHWPAYSRYTHNHFLQLFAELGLAGLVVFLFIIALPFLLWMRRMKEEQVNLDPRFPFFLAGLLFLVHASLDFHLEMPEGVLWFWTLFGLGFPVKHLEAQAKNRSRFGWFLPAAGLLMLIAAGVLQYREASVEAFLEKAEKARDLQEQIGLITKAIHIRPYDDKLLARRAALYQRRGQLSEAYKDYQRAAEADPNRPGYLLGQAYILVQQGKPEKARKTAARALAFNPTFPDIMEGYAVVMFATGLPEEGVHALARAILRREKETEVIPGATAYDLLADYAHESGAEGVTIRLALAVLEFRRGNYARAAAILATTKPLPNQEEEKAVHAGLVRALRDKGF